MLVVFSLVIVAVFLSGVYWWLVTERYEISQHTTLFLVYTTLLRFRTDVFILADAA